MILSRIKYKHKGTFLDYINGGLDLNLSIAVDYTLSNKKHDDPTSLHYMDSTTREKEREWKEKNYYYRSLKLIGEELEDYDADNKIPMYGFGAIVPNGSYYE